MQKKENPSWDKIRKEYLKLDKLAYDLWKNTFTI